MGMAASQARLLTITARIHDVEYKAQSIQNAKIQLATQEDQVYQDYLEALDATTLTVKDYQGNRITANFNNLCGINAIDNGQHYALRLSSGKYNGQLIVSDDIKDAYEEFNGYDAYEFAMFMIYGDSGQSVNYQDVEAAENAVFEAHKDDDSGASKSLAAIKEKMDSMVGDDEENYNNLSNEDKDKYDELEQSYKYLLYKNYSEEIFLEAYKNEEVTEDDFNHEQFEYYARIFKEIQEAGGCVSIIDCGEGEDAASSSEWLQDMIKCGKISISTVSENDKTGQVELNATSVATDTYLEDTTTTTIDKTALAKAEAEYTHKTKEIDKKDKQYDMELSKLETERTALTTEYESVKKVISENVERTFGIFS